MYIHNVIQAAVAAQILLNLRSEGLMLGLSGAAIGLAGAYAFSRFVSALLVGVTTLDPLIHAGCTIALLVVALAAWYGPALRAARSAPLISLRRD
jgi:ABC-type antimicrobial peptide transport system permease subunit